MKNDRNSIKKDNFNLVEDNSVPTEVYMEELEEDCEEVNEESSIGNGAIEGAAGNNKKKRKPKTLIREED